MSHYQNSFLSVDMDGVPWCKEAFANLAADLQKKILRKAVREAAAPIFAAAVCNCPVDQGDLLRSLRLKYSTTKKKGYVAAVVTGKSWFTGDTFYGGFVEFGFHHYGFGNRFQRRLGRSGNNATRGRFIPGQHFVGRAFDDQKYAAMQVAQEQIKRGITRAQRSQNRAAGRS